MVKKYLLFIIVIWKCISINAQNQEKFVLEIRQVFPQNKMEYGRAFDYPEDLNRSKDIQIQKLKGNANYKLDIKRPNKQNSHESIQNIKWIESINGAKSYFKGETRPATSYTKATIWEGYKCDLYGKQVEIKKRREFIYRISMLNSKKSFETDYVEIDSARTQAGRLYKKNFAVERPVKVFICKFERNDTIVVDSLSNDVEYQAYKKQSEEKTKMVLVENELLSMQQNVDRFKEEMDAISMKKDSLKLNGVINCRKILTEMGAIIPDSVFKAEKLDSVYSSVLIDRILPFAKGKQKKELKAPVNMLKKQKEREKIILFTDMIMGVLFPTEDKK